MRALFQAAQLNQDCSSCVGGCALLQPKLYLRFLRVFVMTCMLCFCGIVKVRYFYVRSVFQ